MKTLALCLFLAACGGGGTDANGNPDPVAPPPPQEQLVNEIVVNSITLVINPPVIKGH